MLYAKFSEVFEPIINKSNITTQQMCSNLTTKLLQPFNSWNVCLFILNFLQTIMIFGILIRLFFIPNIHLEAIYKDKYMIIIILVFLTCVLLQYMISDHMNAIKIQHLYNFKIYLIYELLPKISHMYIVSNGSNISQIINKLITLCEQFINVKNSNMLMLAITVIIYFVVSFLLLILLLVVLPSIIVNVNTLFLAQDLKRKNNKEFNKTSMLLFAVYAIIILIAFIILISVYLYVIKNMSKVNITELMLKSQNIHDDTLKNFNIYIENKIYQNDFKSLLRYYSILLIYNIQNSTQHLIMVYCLLICIFLYYYIILISKSSIFKTLQDVFATFDELKNEALYKLLFFIMTGVLSILLLAFICINSFMTIFNNAIIDKKTLQIVLYQFTSIIENIQEIPFNSQNITHYDNLKSISKNINIKFDNVSLSFNNYQVLENVNLELKKGNHYFVVGASGSGKSTLFNIMLKFITNISGNIYLKEKNIFNCDGDRLQYIAYMPQGISMENSDLYENLKYKYHILQQDIYDKVIDIIKDIYDKKTYIRIGCLLYDLFIHSDVFIIIMDEPFAGVAPEEAIKLAEIIKKYIYQPHITVLNSDHTINTLSLLNINKLLYFGNLNTNSKEYITELDIQTAKNNKFINKNIPGIGLTSS